MVDKLLNLILTSNCPTVSIVEFELAPFAEFKSDGNNFPTFHPKTIYKILLTDRDAWWNQSTCIYEQFCVYKIFTCTFHFHWYSTLQERSCFNHVNVWPLWRLVGWEVLKMALHVVIFTFTFDTICWLSILRAVYVLMLSPTVPTKQGFALTHEMTSTTLKAGGLLHLSLLDGIDVLLRICASKSLLKLKNWIA